MYILCINIYIIIYILYIDTLQPAASCPSVFPTWPSPSPPRTWADFTRNAELGPCFEIENGHGWLIYPWKIMEKC